MGASNAKPSKPDLQNKHCVPDILEETSGPAEDQISSQKPSCLEPLGDIYTGVLTADIRSDYLYTGLLGHYRLGNAITVSFNLVPTAANDPAYLYKHRAVIRLAPLKRCQAVGGVEYDLEIETSMMMAYKMIFDKDVSSTNSNNSITIASTSVTELTTLITECSTTSSIKCTSSSKGESASIVKDNTEEIASGMKDNGTQNISILEKIAQYSSQGGRIMCITKMGALDQTLASRIDLFNPKSRFNAVLYSVVDIFLEVPRPPLPAMFIYQVVTTLIPYRVKRFRNKEISVVFDYMDFFITHLNQGWKLVGVIQYYAVKNRLNSAWFFEKEKTRINDSSPVYEGTIVVHKHIRESATKGQEMIKSDVQPILQEMGAKGWEIACSLETPEAKRLNKTTTQINILLFFQRRIINPH